MHPGALAESAPWRVPQRGAARAEEPTATPIVVPGTSTLGTSLQRKAISSLGTVARAARSRGRFVRGTQGRRQLTVDWCSVAVAVERIEAPLLKFDERFFQLLFKRVSPPLFDARCTPRWSCRISD